MIFDVLPAQIESLGSKELVELLGKLLHAEARKAGINLRGVSVPLQITITDGGEDARVGWSGGLEKTDYLPSRFSIFQSKASDPGPAGWKKETWAKSSTKFGKTRKLQPAITKALSQNGSYIGFTATAIIGQRYDDRIQSIKDGILEAGGNPDKLTAIDIYDANKIAAWSSQHPSVAIWLNERRSSLTLGGFQTIDGWAKKSEVTSIQHVEDSAPRYLLGGENLVSQEEQRSPEKNALTSQQAKERISDYLLQPRASVRLVGASGLGKSRFVFEVFKDVSTISKLSNSGSAIYCNYQSVSQQLLPITDALSQKKSPAVLIVDDCPREVAERLINIIDSADSELRLLTLDTDDRPIQRANCLNVSLDRSDDALVEGIIRQKIPKAGNSEISYIKNLCGGYPRIAVLAAESFVSHVPLLKSIDDVVDRILAGCGIVDRDQVRAVECLSLFEKLAADGDFAEQFDLVADKLAGLTGDRMYEHIARASQHHLVERRGRFFVAQPAPIAAVLGARRLESLRGKTLVDFVKSASPGLLESFFSRWRHFDVTRAAVDLAQQLLGKDGAFGTFEALNTEHGSHCLDLLVHVTPDTAADTLNRVFGKLSIDELKEVTQGRRSLVYALEKLVFRNRSFAIAARLLMRLGAAENERWANNASGQFKQIFQLHLSGTEASPADRFAILDEGLSSGDDRIVSICVEALNKTLDRHHFSRSGGSEEIGSQPPLKDWHAKLWSEVFDFHRNGLKRLVYLRGANKAYAKRCEEIIASHIRGLMGGNLFDDIEPIVIAIAREKGTWLEGIKAVGEWLYFDRQGPKKFSKKVRKLYDNLLPTDLVDRALLYTKFWSMDIHDPDEKYDASSTSTNDFEYASRKAKALAAEIALDGDATDRVVRAMAAQELNNAFPFAHELGLKSSNPIAVFRLAVKIYEETKETRGTQFIRGLLSGVEERDRSLGSSCVQIALESPSLKAQSVNIYTAVNITAERLQNIVESLREGNIAPGDCVALSYGRGLDSLSAREISPLLDAIISHQDPTSIWAALEIISMHQHGRTSLDAELANRLRELLTSPKLLEKNRRGSHDGYLFESFVKLINKHGGIDEQFAANLSDQIVRVCQLKNHDMFFALDDPIRKVITLLVAIKPRVIWRTISRFVEVASPVERHWLDSLMGPNRGGFDGEGQNKQGILFEVPAQDLLEWARSDPANRIGFLCAFYPLLASEPEGPTWHIELEKLAAEFGAIAQFRRAIAIRLHPTSWSGSIVPHLKVYLRPLEKWFTHPIPELSLWAREIHRSLERQIASEKREEEEGK